MATATLYLDKRARKKDGTYPLKVTISHKGNTARIALGLSLASDQWDEKARKVVAHTSKQMLNNFITQRLLNIRNALLQLQTQGALHNKSITQVRDMVVAALNEGNDDEQKTTFAQWFAHFRDKHTNERTREIYESTWTWIEKFEPRANALRFEDITKDWLERLSVFMSSSSPSQNARNIHFRNIRAVFNDALDNELTSCYPFRRFKIRPVATPKRNLKPAQLRQLFNASVPAWQQKYIDAFKLMFLLLGINIGDLCTVTSENVNGNRLEFNRKKTKRLYSIKIEPEAAELIERYRGTDTLVNFANNYRNYHHFGNRLNLNLSQLMPNVTTYWARHSWATIAAALDVPDDTIAAALGHSGANTTTSIYIERERRKVDEANRRVIDFVLYDKK